MSAFFSRESGTALARAVTSIPGPVTRVTQASNIFPEKGALFPVLPVRTQFIMLFPPGGIFRRFKGNRDMQQPVTARVFPDDSPGGLHARRAESEDAAICLGI
jgi:hypothetical protein